MESLVNNIDLFMFMRRELDSLSDSAKLCERLMSSFVTELNESEKALLSKFCIDFCSKIVGRWKKACRNFPHFLQQNEDWLESAILWPDMLTSRMERRSEVMTESGIVLHDEEGLREVEKENLPSTSSASTTLYTPRKPFEELSDKQKRRRIDLSINKACSPEELTKTATQMCKYSGHESVSRIMEHLLKHPEDVEEVEAFLCNKKKDDVYTPEKALGIITSLKLSKWQYITLRESASEQGSDIYPSYYKVQQAKTQCYPPDSDITVTEDGAHIKLQSLLDLTVSRLVSAYNLVLASGADNILTCKWGFDGAAGQSTYKLVGGDSSTVFMTSMVPLKLESDNVTVWENDRPSSTFLCRPIMFKFMKETKENILEEKNRMEKEIGSLQPSKINQQSVKHKMLLTMIDGKIASILSDSSSFAVCDICRAKPSEMNDLLKLKEMRPNEEIFQYGLSSLHAWIRCMECLLHIAYRLDFKKWSARDTDKNTMAQRKQLIQESFKNEFGLLIDVVKPGAGTTNDGNTARKFFRDSKTSARLTGLNEELIERFYVVLQTISCGEPVNVPQFSEFCQETANFYVQLYPWYYMPSSVHKLLIHGAAIIEHFGLIPIGTLSEEVSESRNKDFRNYREHHSRKISRTASNRDLLNNLLLSSDPQLSKIRPRMTQKTRMALSAKAISLLIPFSGETSETEFIDVSKLDDSE